MTKPYFTVAVIAYQTEPSLQKALNSVSGQTFPDFECLMVVEESTDRSLEICKKMECRDPRFKTVQLPKSGSASASRNYAMAHAEGEYIAFLDGDDWFMPEMLEKVYTANEKFRYLDIIQFTFHKVFQQPDGTFSAPQHLSELPPEAMNRLLTGQEMTLLTGTAGTVFGATAINVCRADFLRKNELYQNRGLILEDFEWVFRCWFLAKRIVCLPDPLYVYCRRNDSITTEKSPRFLFDMVRQFACVPPFIRKYRVPLSIQRIWANKWTSRILDTFFHPRNNEKLTMADRKAAAKILFASGNTATLKRCARLATLPKRIGMSVFLLSRYTGMLPAMFFFQKIYFPAIKRKLKK